MKKLIVLFALMAFLAIGSTAMAQTGEYNVTLAGGYVYDVNTNNSAVVGADVTVHCVESNETRTGTTDANGYYLVSIPCSVDDTVQVTATKDSDSGSNSGLVTAYGIVTMGSTTINVGVTQIDVVIPEFPIAALPALLSMFSFGIIRKKLF